MQAKEIRCPDCNRYLGKAFGTVVAEIKCPNSKCKKTVQVKIITTDPTADMRHKFVTVEEPKNE